MAHRTRTIPCLILLILLAWQIGCTGMAQHRQPLQLQTQLALDETVRAQLGKTGIIALDGTPEINLEVSPKGWTGGAKRAAWIGSVYGGFTVGILACLPSGMLAGLLCPILFYAGYIPGSGIGALVGAPLGAVRAEPVATVEQAEASFKILLADPTIPELLKDSVVQLVGKQTSNDVVPMAAGESGTRNDATDYPSFVDNGIFTILELKVTAAGLCGGKELSFDPLLRVCMTVRSRLIRTSDGTVLDERTIAFDDRRADDRVRMEPLGGRRAFTQWTANNGQLLQDELARTVKGLAEKIVEELFLLYPVLATSL